MQVSAEPVAYQGVSERFGERRAARVAAVVEMVSVAVAAEVPEMLTDVVEPKDFRGQIAQPLVRNTGSDSILG